LTGHPFKSKEFTDNPEDIRLLRGDNVAQGYFRWEKAKRWNAEQYDDFAKLQLRVGDVILAMDRPWIAAGLKYGWITERDLPALLVQRVARMRGCNGLTTDYLRYLIGSSDFTDHVLSIITGVNVPHISGRDIKAFKFKLPPLPTQQCIAAILSAYDDLIENNTRRIAILEEMARRLYEEWFVHFRFPGHEEVEFDGELPEGWSYVPLKTVARLRSGYAFKSKTFTDNGKHRLVTIKNVQDGGFDPNNVNKMDDVPSNVPQHCHLSSGDVLLSLTGNVGRVCVVYGGDFLLNQRVAKIEPASAEFRAFLYYTFRDAEFRQRLENLATGVAQQNLSPVKTEELLISLPNQHLIEQYEAFAGPVMAQCRLLDETNANLRAQRDLLLPKLVSGEIDVSEAEEAMEAAE
jgi:type I restriction enzyme S subunit